MTRRGSVSGARHSSGGESKQSSNRDMDRSGSANHAVEAEEDTMNAFETGELFWVGLSLSLDLKRNLKPVLS